MTTLADDFLIEIEEKRALLEKNVATLRKTLQLWQKWSFEYEALKEDVEALSANASAKQLKSVGEAFEGDVLNKKEINELLGLDKGISRSPEQVSSLLSRRLDYVQQNVGTVQKQLDATELKLADMGSDEIPLVQQDDILPVTEILEELDEAGNVLSGKLSRPGEETSGLVNVLRKAGLKDDDVPETDEQPGNEEPPKSGNIASDPKTTHNTADSETTPPTPQEQQKEEAISTRRKSVTFAEDTKGESTTTATSHKFSPKSPSPLSSQVLQPVLTQPDTSKTKVFTNFSPHNRVIELDDDDQEVGSQLPAIPIEESVEDAAMRREMLAYSMNEMGSIVAQLDLEESYYSNDDEDDEDDEEEEGDEYGTATDDEEETEFGMSTKSAMDEEYRKEMLELESRLSARYFENLGPQATDVPNGSEAVDVQQLAKHTARVAIKDDADMPKRPSRPSPEEPTPAIPQGPIEKGAPKTKKGVRFAEDLDVAPAPSKLAVKETLAVKSQPISATAGVRDTIIERAPNVSKPAIPSAPETTAPKVSRFKAARATASAPTQSASESPGSATNTPSSRLTTPADSPILSRIVERAPAPSSIIPAEPDELDPEMMRRQVAEEYYKQRNRRIAKQGGFRQEVQEEQEMEDDADAYNGGGVRDVLEEDDEEEDEQPKKMSLFRKARLRQGKGW